MELNDIKEGLQEALEHLRTSLVEDFCELIEDHSAKSSQRIESIDLLKEAYESKLDVRLSQLGQFGMD